jgi:CDP-glucose 4,6-dehydratase
LVTAAYQRSFFHAPVQGRTVALASARAGNVIGGGDWAQDRLVPDIMRAFLEDRPVTIRNPNAIRPWQHVLEPVGAYLSLAKRMWGEPTRFASGWNFGPHAEAARPVREVVELITQHWGAPRRWIDESDPSAVHEAKLLFLDITKARMELGWTPRWNLTEALKNTIIWYQEADRGGDMRTMTEKQIDLYTRAVSA